MSKTNSPGTKKRPVLQLIAGGTAGFVETSFCHPLDTIKTRMQLRRKQSTAIRAIRGRSSVISNSQRKNSSTKCAKAQCTCGMSSLAEARLSPGAPSANAATISLGPVGTARRIVEREGFFSLYRGLTAMWCGIVPQMAIRFFTFEQYRQGLQRLAGPPPPGSEYSPSVNFAAGLSSGLTEAVVIVTPAELIKIRMQAQYHSGIEPEQLKRRKYRNVIQAAITIVREEGVGALYQGILPTMMRQGCNQGVNFYTFHTFKKKVLEVQNKKELDHWQSLVLGGISSGFGPMMNHPLDIVKTRMQKQVIEPGKPPKYTGVVQAIGRIYENEGFFHLWKGITPRLMRVIPGHAIMFMTYEAISSALNRQTYF